MDQLPAEDAPPNGVVTWANSPVHELALIKAPNSAVPKLPDVEPNPPHVISLLEPLYLVFQSNELSGENLLCRFDLAPD